MASGRTPSPKPEGAEISTWWGSSRSIPRGGSRSARAVCGLANFRFSASTSPGESLRFVLEELWTAMRALCRGQDVLICAILNTPIEKLGHCVDQGSVLGVAGAEGRGPSMPYLLTGGLQRTEGRGRHELFGSLPGAGLPSLSLFADHLCPKKSPLSRNRAGPAWTWRDLVCAHWGSFPYDYSGRSWTNRWRRVCVRKLIAGESDIRSLLVGPSPVRERTSLDVEH
jgi:hypothetical protein